MVKERMDLLGLLRERGSDGDVDFLREALRVLVEGIMDAEVSVRIVPCSNHECRRSVGSYAEDADQAWRSQTGE